MRKKVPLNKYFSVALKKISRALAFCITLFSSFFSYSQAQLIKDVNTKENPYIQEYSEVINDGKGNVYFVSRGKELWVIKTANTPQTAVMIKSLRSIANLTIAGNTVFFVGEDAAGKELWKTNGTGATTRMLKDINAGSNWGSPSFLTNVNGILYFAAYSQAYGNELWKTDGTEAGTVMVKDFNPGPSDGNPQWIVEMNGMIYLAAQGASKGRELWKTNGTSAGSQMVKDIYAGTQGSSPTHLTAVNGKLFFTAFEPTYGRELYMSDGTSDGTVFIENIVPGNQNLNVKTMVALGNTCYFTADTGNGEQLWKTNGPNTTSRLTSFSEYCELDPESDYYDPDCPRLALKYFKVIANGLYFVKSTSYNADMYRVDGSTGEVRHTFNLTYDGYNPRYTALGDGIYFFNFAWTDFKPEDSHNEEQQALQLFKMTLQGTEPQLIRNFHHEYSFEDGSLPKPEMTVANNQLYFPGILNDGEGYKMLRSSGNTEAYIVKDSYHATLSSHPRNMITHNGITYFTTGDYNYNRQVWRTDGTTAGTFMLKEFDAVLNMTISGNALYILADVGYPYDELWKTDGTTAGTVMLKRFEGNQFGFSYTQVQDVYGMLYFASEVGTLWRSNGTAAGTVALKDFNRVNYIGKGGGRAIFSVMIDGRHELWRSNGTTNSTAKLKTIHPSPHYVWNPVTRRTTANDIYYFVADDPKYGREVWRSDGTTSGTYLLKDLRADDNMTFDENFILTSFRDSLYFSAQITTLQHALFKSDGTTAGTLKVADIPPPFALISADNYLSILSGSESPEIWSTAGTAGSTKFLRRISLMPSSYNLSSTVADGVTYVTSDYASHLWRTDGTACGTFSLDVPADPYPVIRNGDNLIFGAYTEPYGREPYRLSLSAVPPSPCAEETTFAQTQVSGLKAVEYGPNPFTEKVTLKVNGKTTDNVSLAVKSFTGEIVHRADNLSPSTDLVLGDNWPAGLYVVEVNVNGKSQSFRLVKK